MADSPPKYGEQQQPPPAYTTSATEPPPPIDAPPAAAASSSSTAQTNSNNIAPGTLCLTDRFIYNVGSSTASAPLYELSQSLPSLRDINRKVAIERLDYSVKAGSSGPHVTTRKKLLFNLQRPHEILSPTFAYYVESASRQTLGSLSVRLVSSSSSLGRRRFVVGKLVTSSAKGMDFDERETLFETAQVERKGNAYEWKLVSTGEVIAYDGEEAEQGGLWRMQIVVAAERMTIDALVAAWCLRIWQNLAEDSRWEEGWKNFKKIVRTNRGHRQWAS